MRLSCPHCGERSSGEFAYLGDAALRRPAPGAPEADWEAYVHLRDNPAGRHREHWLHAQGCRLLLVVARDATSHRVLSVEAAAP